MAEEYDNEMRGVLFRVAEDKRTDRGPIMRGNCQIDGVLYNMSVWGNTSQKGVKYWSIRFQLDEGRDDERKAKKARSRKAKESSQEPLKGEEERDDAIPF